MTTRYSFLTGRELISYCNEALTMSPEYCAEYVQELVERFGNVIVAAEQQAEAIDATVAILDASEIIEYPDFGSDNEVLLAINGR